MYDCFVRGTLSGVVSGGSSRSRVSSRLSNALTLAREGASIEAIVVGAIGFLCDGFGCASQDALSPSAAQTTKEDAARAVIVAKGWVA
jgi:hypothetical protein